jgi:hypothetical protein
MIKIDLAGPEGNVFSLMGLASVLLKNRGHSRVYVDEVLADMRSQDYIHALDVFDSHLSPEVEFFNDPRKTKPS